MGSACFGAASGSHVGAVLRGLDGRGRGAERKAGEGRGCGAGHSAPELGITNVLGGVSGVLLTCCGRAALGHGRGDAL